MSPKPFIDVIIDPKTGNFEVEAHGFKGKACREATAKILAGLGRVTQSKNKAEFFQQAGVKRTQTAGSGA